MLLLLCLAGPVTAEHVGWVRVINKTDHHAIGVRINGQYRGKVDPLHARIFTLAQGEYHLEAVDHEGRTTGTKHVLVHAGHTVDWTVDH